jgi:hypothetical protein
MKYNKKRVEKLKAKEKAKISDHEQPCEALSVKESHMPPRTESKTDNDNSVSVKAKSEDIKNNLDIICFDTAKEIVPPNKETYKAAIDCLSVLQNDGLFAMFLFLHSNSAKDAHKKISDCLLCLGKSLNLIAAKNLESVRDAATNLNGLFFFIDMCERTLIYAKYLLDAEIDKQENAA